MSSSYRNARVVVLADVALAEDDLEQVRLAVRRAEHLGAGHEIGAPHAPEALVEALWIQRVDLVPVAIEAAAPLVQRQRVVAAQVLDVDDFEPGVLHRRDGL